MPSNNASHQRIVGLGASAGGLQALEQFFTAMPADSGLACIVVQHLDPTHKALLSELLQRVTPLTVQEARQGMVIAPDNVYVIPPNTELSITDGRLHLASPGELRGRRLPVDVLFSSMARALGDQAIAVVLSGMGSDGTQGLQAIKAVGGLTLVQSPDEAQFDAMPKSAIAAGCADLVAPAGELPERMLSLLLRAREGAGVSLPAKPEDPRHESLHQILRLLQKHTRHDFSLYKPSSLHRRIERRMAIHGLDSLSAYEHFLTENPQEVDLLFKELLIGVTGFFRDTGAWKMLADQVLPDLVARHEAHTTLRAWAVGCSTGEEAYSLAMVLTEALDRLPDPHTLGLQIFASDLSPDAIAKARRGEYPLSIRENVSEERLERFFIAHENHYQVTPGLRNKVMFAQHDVVLDPPFTRLDLLACRNLLIYFDSQLQHKLLPLFHYCLRPGGILMLGSAESIGRMNTLFQPLSSKLRLFQRLDRPPAIKGKDMLLASFPPLSSLSKESHVPATQPPRSTADNLQNAADQVLLQVYAPAAVVINQDGDIVYISGRTGNYLEPAAGKANWNLHAMAREGLRTPLTKALKQAAEQHTPVHLPRLTVVAPGGELQVDVTIQPFTEPAALRGMTMVLFQDRGEPARSALPRAKGKGSRESPHAAEIRQYQVEIEALREEVRSYREEQQSTHEALQSSNEELQSANEELTTSKEEMQSMNEELQTINTELQTKLDDLALAQSDMQNVLNSIEIAILFLDQDLNVRRYTDRATQIINLRERDLGRPLSDLTTQLRYPKLTEDARETLRTLAYREKEIATNDERWFNVRIMPYRRLDNVIDGVVITLVDITQTKQLEQQLRQESTQQ